jgi:ubiquitin carboxyl-terminal hydrolase L5
MILINRKQAAQKGFGLQTRSVSLYVSYSFPLTYLAKTASNACASVALLNIVNNIEGVDLGENLRHFREFTMPFTPALRGDAINNFEFVKRIHNSFARLVVCYTPTPPLVLLHNPSYHRVIVTSTHI